MRAASISIFMGIGRATDGNGRVYMVRYLPKQAKETAKERALYAAGELKLQKLVAATPQPVFPRVADVAASDNGALMIVYEENVGTITLHDAVNDGLIGPQNALPIFRKIVGMIQFIHQNNRIFRDIKLTRFAFRKDTPISDADIVLLSCECITEIGGGAYEDHHASPAYVAPEILEARVDPAYLKRTDMWSLGVLLYILMVRKYPFQSDRPKELFEKIRQGDAEYPETILADHPFEISIIKRLLVKNPADRPSIDVLAKDLCEHFDEDNQVVPNDQEDCLSQHPAQEPNRRGLQAIQFLEQKLEPSSSTA